MASMIRVKQLAGGTDKRFGLPILFMARAFPHKHQSGRGLPSPKTM